MGTPYRNANDEFFCEFENDLGGKTTLQGNKKRRSVFKMQDEARQVNGNQIKTDMEYYEKEDAQKGKLVVESNYLTEEFRNCKYDDDGNIIFYERYCNGKKDLYSTVTAEYDSEHHILYSEERYEEKARERMKCDAEKMRYEYDPVSGQPTSKKKTC